MTPAVSAGVKTAVSVVSSIANIVKGIFSSNVKRGWEGMSPSARSNIAGWFTLFYYINRGDRINYWHPYLAEMGGGSGERSKEYERRFQTMWNEALGLCAKAGMPRDQVSAIFVAGQSSPVATNGQWSPPSSITPKGGSISAVTTAKTTTEAQIEQASAFPVVPMLIIGGVLYFFGPKLVKAFNSMARR